jgi:hypothetical protein
VKVFGKENHAFKMANHTFLAIDTISLSSGDPSLPFFQAANTFTASAIETGEFKRGFLNQNKQSLR